MTEVEEILDAMEAMGIAECGPAPERCLHLVKGEGRICTVHRERQATMAVAFWRVWDLEEERRSKGDGEPDSNSPSPAS